MCNVYFIGCLHLGDANMARHRGFIDATTHDDVLIQQWNSIVTSRDLTYILGDITMEKKEPYYKLDLLYGRKIAVLGNHDRHQDVAELLKYVEGVAGMIKYKNCILSHAPVHPSELGF